MEAIPQSRVPRLPSVCVCVKLTKTNRHSFIKDNQVKSLDSVAQIFDSFDDFFFFLLTCCDLDSKCPWHVHGFSVWFLSAILEVLRALGSGTELRGSRTLEMYHEG